MATIVVGGLLIGGVAVGAAGIATGVSAGAIAYRRNKRKKKKKALRKKLFNEPIGGLESKYITDRGIPVVVELTARQLEESGLETEGLFRVPGSVIRIQKLADSFRRGTVKALEKLNLALECSHDVGGIFKLYFRSMPESLCTYELYNEFREVHSLKLMMIIFGDKARELTDKQWIEEVVLIMGKLPPINRRVFTRILPFFAQICEKSDINKMTVDNMSIVFGPTLFYPKNADPMAMLSDSTNICGLLTKMIQNQAVLVERITATDVNFKLSKSTINASMLFKQQHLVTDMFEPTEDDTTDTDMLEELEEIRDLLEDDFTLGDDFSEDEEIDTLKQQDTETYQNTFSPRGSGSQISPRDAFIPPQALAGTPLPTPPSRRSGVFTNVSDVHRANSETQVYRSLPKMAPPPTPASVGREDSSDELPVANNNNNNQFARPNRPTPPPRPPRQSPAAS